MVDKLYDPYCTVFQRNERSRLKDIILSGLREKPRTNNSRLKASARESCWQREATRGVGGRSGGVGLSKVLELSRLHHKHQVLHAGDVHAEFGVVSVGFHSFFCLLFLFFLFPHLFFCNGSMQLEAACSFSSHQDPKLLHRNCLKHCLSNH